MCEFPSWIEQDDGTILYLTDRDIPRLTDQLKADCCGHKALRSVYPGAGGKDCKGWPPPFEILEEIRRGRMKEMARNGGVDVHILRDGDVVGRIDSGVWLLLCGEARIDEVSVAARVYVMGGDECDDGDESDTHLDVGTVSGGYVGACGGTLTVLDRK